MLIDRSHKNWIVFTLVASAASLGAYMLYRSAALQEGGRGPSGGSVPGLIWGGLALGLMIFCGLLGVRKKLRIWRLGRAQSWMRAHIWLGLLTVPLVLCHSGMRMGNNLSLAIMILFIIVIVSGVIGLVLQNMIPMMMLDRVKAETTFEQIEHVYDLLRDEADEIIDTVCGPMVAPDTSAFTGIKEAVAAAAAQPKRGTVMVLKSKGQVQGKSPKEKGPVSGPIAGAEPLRTLYFREVRPFLARRIPAGSRLASSQGANSVFEYVRTLVPASAHPAVDDIASICEERRQLALQQRLHLILHGWLFVHTPISYLLLLLTLIHAVVAPLWY